MGIKDPTQLGDASEVVLVDVHDTNRKILFDLPMCTPINGIPDIHDYANPFGLRLKPDTPLATKGKHLYLDDSNCKPKTGGDK